MISSQTALGAGPYRNANRFSGDYLDELTARTDDLIDEIVHDIYGPSEAERGG